MTEPQPKPSFDQRTLPVCQSTQRNCVPSSCRPWKPYSSPLTYTGVLKWADSDSSFSHSVFSPSFVTFSTVAPTL